MQRQQLRAAGRTVSRSAVVAPRVSSRRSTVVCNARKVALLGAAGGIGQPLALLLKMNKFVTELALYDIANVVGVAADISHCNTPVKVTAYTGPEELAGALKDADLVVIPAGVPRKPGMTRDDLFNTNAGIVRDLIVAVAKHAPNAMIEIITNPVNSTVPIAAEVLTAAGVFNPKKLLGVTSLDVVRANTFIAEAKGLDVRDVDVPVIGGHAGVTILPLISQCTPTVSFTDEEKAAMIDKIQNAGTVVVEANRQGVSDPLHGIRCRTHGRVHAAGHERRATRLRVVPGFPFFASRVLLGKDGVSKVYGLGKLDTFETKALEALKPELMGSIEKGVAFAAAAAPAAAAPSA
ncbi:MAG: hypothetical protein WDW38_001378 [Sanguina aurantia]